MANSYIIAIDFGTAYSGYAFSIASETIRVNFWGQGHGYRTPKTPTCILFDEHEQFQKFGYEAKQAYATMDGAKAQNMYLFDTFKMELYDKKITEDISITAKNGKSMSALKVITETLRYLKDHALECISEHTNGKKFLASDFTWVLTLPAIWDAAAKQFMKKAAVQAGLVTESNVDMLVLALEPEAASVWCMQLPSDGFVAEDSKNTEQETLARAPGTQYIVLDCGGGTIDITVHEVLENDQLKELHCASGNDMGGETVDKRFKAFLRNMFTGELMDEYEKLHPSELQTMMNAFSLGKDSDEEIYIPCGYNLMDLAKSMKAMPNTAQSAFCDSGNIRLSKDLIKSLMNESLNKIADSISTILKKDLKIEYIILVGGFASSKLLKRRIKSQFGDKCKVLCPVDPQMAIVKGAVMFGKKPEVVASRVSSLTYGIAISSIFEPSKHKEEKKYENQDGVWCDDLFQKLVTKGESVGCDEVRKHSFSPVGRDQTNAEFKFYSTTRLDPSYVDEWGLEPIGSCTVSMPLISKGIDRNVSLEIKFGFTEMQATATDVESNETVKTTLDFMRK